MWFSANRLSLNVAKTNYMFFEKRKLTVDISIKMNKEVINIVCVTKFVGVMIDDKLKLNFWQYPAIHTNYSSSNCAILN